MSSVSAGSSVTIEPPLLRRAVLHDVHAISIPARRFTGDFFHTRRSADALWLGVGDVAGKGIAAAVGMAAIQEVLESELGSHVPETMIARLDGVLRQILPPNRFATAAVLRLRDDGTLLAANAGHCPPLILRADGSVESIGSTGPAAGILENATWRTVGRRLAPGEALLLYTDGVVEANDFGVERLSEVFRAAARRSARSITGAVVDALRAHGGVEDDLTVVAVRVVRARDIGRRSGAEPGVGDEGRERFLPLPHRRR